MYTIKLQNFMEIKKPQLGKVGAFAIFLKREVLQHLPDTTMLVKYSIDKGTESTWREDIDNTPKMKLAQKAIELNLSEQQMIKAERRPNISLFATNEFS